MELTTKRYQSISYISGPLLFVEGAKDLAYGAIVNIHLPDDTMRGGQVIEVSEKNAVIQVFEETTGLDLAKTSISLREDVARLGVSKEMIGRRFSGLGEPIDGLPPLIPEKRLPIIGAPINPVARQRPQEFIQTGISAIDGLNTLVRGQKLPIFSGAGLPHNEIAAQIARQAKVLGSQEQFSVVFAAMGITQREAAFFIDQFESTGALARSVVFLNLADDPAIERLITPRVALTAAEFLAFEMDMQVLVILSDMTNYCESLREIGAAREEIPGRRGYPGYMYTDLATIYERAGRIHDRKGSITQLPLLTMPDDDITHPIADLTGYITEVQILLSRELHRLGFYPPITPLRSLSRLMNDGIGKGRTREDHGALRDQLYSAYANGVDLRKLVASMPEAVSPTRMNLLQRKQQAKVAVQGVDLLKRKRDALVADFFNIVRQSLVARERLTKACEEAYVMLALAKAWEGREALEAAAMADRREVLVDIDIRNVWGTKIPEVSVKEVRRSLSERGHNPTTTSVRTVESAANFEEVLRAILEVAATEIKLKKIGQEIKKTTRRVNALEQVVIPRIMGEIRFITAVLEQRAREDVFRLKRIKAKLEARERIS